MIKVVDIFNHLVEYAKGDDPQIIFNRDINNKYINVLPKIPTLPDTVIVYVHDALVLTKYVTSIRNMEIAHDSTLPKHKQIFNL